MITAMDEMIEEARRMAKSKRIRATERIRWTRLVGQLIWYKDSILKNNTYEALEVEVWMLKEEVLGKRPADTPSQGYTISPSKPVPQPANETPG